MQQDPDQAETEDDKAWTGGMSSLDFISSATLKMAQRR